MLVPNIRIRQDIFQTIFVEINVSNIFKSSFGITVSCSYTWEDVDRVVHILGVCKKRVVAKHVHRALIVQEDPV